MKTTLVKTRWYFCTEIKGYIVEACVEFSRNSNGRKQVNVYDTAGRELLFFPLGLAEWIGLRQRQPLRYGPNKNPKKKSPLVV